jgi:hypothetical protein
MWLVKIANDFAIAFLTKNTIYPVEEEAKNNE